MAAPKRQPAAPRQPRIREITGQMVGVQAKVHVEQASWLADQAAEHESSISEVIRSAIWLAMRDAGDVEIVHEDAGR